MASKPFLPRDKPKSWIVMVLASLTNLLVVGPLMFLSAEWKAGVVFSVVLGLFTTVWVVAFSCGLFCVVRFLGGRYGAIASRSWRDQVW